MSAAEAIQMAFGWAVGAGIPMLVAVMLMAIIAGMFTNMSGIQEPALGLVVRALAVVGTLALFGAALAEHAVAFTHAVWDGLASAGSHTP